MYDVPRVTFLIVADTVLVAMLVMLLVGCTATPTRYRHGDFIMNIGSTASSISPAPPPAATTKVAHASAQNRA